MTLVRILFAAAIVFVAMYSYRRFVLPFFPSLDTGLIRFLVVGAVGATAWRLVHRGESSR